MQADARIAAQLIQVTCQKTHQQLLQVVQCTSQMKGFQDAAIAMITSATHSNISVSYDDATNKLSVSLISNTMTHLQDRLIRWVRY